MKQGFQFLTLIALIAALTVTSEARQTVAPAQQRPRIVAQQTPRGTSKAGKQAEQLPRNLTADQPTPPKRNEQQQKNRIANAVVDKYVGGFQKGVDLNDEQTRRLSGRLGNYVRQQLKLAEQRSAAINRLNELNDQKASDEEIQAQNKRLEEAETQQINAKNRFYNDVNPELTVQQRSKLKVYMDRTEQNVRQAIQKSRDN